MKSTLPATGHPIIQNALVAAIYGALGLASLGIAQSTGLAAPVWPAAGVAFAIVYQRGWQLVPGVIVGSLVVNVVTLGAEETATSAVVVVASAVAVGAGLQAWAGGSLVRRLLGQRISLSRAGQILAFLALAGPVACLINPTVGTAAQLWQGVLSADLVGIGWLTWWVGDSIGVIAFAPVALMLLPEQAEIWRGRRWQVAVPSVIAVLTFAGVFAQSAAEHEAAAQADLDALAQTAVGGLQERLSRHQEVVEGLGGLMEASTLVSAQEFDVFTSKALDRFPSMQALSWNPVVARSELRSFESSQRAELAVPDYAVTQRGTDGALEPVTPRAEYVPVAYIEPLPTNREALGFDIGSDPVTEETMRAARDSGTSTATRPIDLVQGSEAVRGMLALRPVYDGAQTPGDLAARRELIRGYAAAAYRLDDLVQESFADSTWNDFSLQLADVTSAGEPVAITGRRALNEEVVDVSTREVLTSTSAPFPVYDRSWQLTITPNSGPLRSATHEEAPALLVGGLLVIGLLEAFLLLVTGLERQARREAVTANYEAAHDHLTGLFNRRAFMSQLGVVCERSRAEDSDHALLYLDVDGFKQVNDIGGHEAGDAMLRQLAGIFRAHVRSRDVVARIGGDEFAVILNNCHVARAVAIAQGLVAAVDEHSLQVRGRSLAVGLSVGVAAIDPDDPVDADEVLRRADEACYVVKRTGRGGVHSFAADVRASRRSPT